MEQLVVRLGSTESEKIHWLVWSSLEEEIIASGELQDAMEKGQRQDKFSEALHQLPEELRDILILHRYQQLRYDEIAELFDINLNTLKSKMRKAVSELHKHYSLLTGGEES